MLCNTCYIDSFKARWKEYKGKQKQDHKESLARVRILKWYKMLSAENFKYINISFVYVYK